MSPGISAVKITIPFNRDGGTDWDTYWASLISATVENAAPTNVVLTFPVAASTVATDVTATVNGVARVVSSASWTGAVWTVVLESAVIATDNVVMTFKALYTTAVAINVSFVDRINTLFTGHITAIYPLNEAAGAATAEDLSGNNLDAPYNYAKTLGGAGIFGQTSVKLTSDISIVNMATAGIIAAVDMKEGYCGILLKVDNVSYWAAANYICRLRADANNLMYLNTSSNTLALTLIANGTNVGVSCAAPQGTGWYYISAGWSDSGDKIGVYVNGIKQNSATGIGTWAGDLAIAEFDKIATGQTCNYQDYFLLDYYPTDADIFSSYNPVSTVGYVGDSRMDVKIWTSKALDFFQNGGSFGYNKWALSDSAVSGDGVAQLAARAAATNALIISTNDIMVVWCSVNDYTLTAQQMYDGLKSYCEAAKVAGWSKVIICTEIDCQDASRITNDWPTK